MSGGNAKMEKMTKEELLQLCKYYKGADDCPFKHGDPKALFWSIEMQYVRNAMDSIDFHNSWILEAESYMENFKDNENVITGNSITIEQKGIILYIDAMISKWMPYDEGTIFEY